MGAGGSKKYQQNRDLGGRPSPPGKPILIPGTPRTDPDVISIRWDPPRYCGGSKIVGYLVEHRRTGSPHWVRATPLLVRGTTLTLSGLEPGMRYQFRVTAENFAGKSDPGILSEAFAVSYQRHVSLAPSFNKHLIDQTAIENEKVEFTVVVEGMPTPNISWYKDGVEIFSTRRQRIIVDGERSSFIIHQAALQDEGEIKCTATNIAGHVVTKARLVIEAGAGLRLPRQYEEGLLFELGEAVRLRVGIIGKPDPSVSWYHNGVEMQSGGRVELIRKDKYACLKINEAVREDRGEYRVTSTNKLGSDSASILVTITDRPLQPGKAQVVMTLGRCVTLAWTPPNDDGGCKIGNYIVEYYRIGWNMWLKAATCRQLTTTLGDLIEGSEYKFRVKAENPYGISDPSSESDVVFIPDPKRGLLEAPPKSDRTDTLMLDSAEWQEATRKHKELEAAKQKADKEWDAVPSQVSLANQVLRKVKMAPKRGWSEDSQGSPPTTPERQLYPVPPKRKIRDKRKAQAILHEEPLGETDENELYSQVTRIRELHASADLRRYSNADEMVHSSSEMVFVLMPGENDQKEDEGDEMDEDNENYNKESTVAVPPISFSCPELGSCDPYETEILRVSVSSSELLHERTLARMNKEIADEEAEHVLQTKYGIERKRSFERRIKREPYVAPPIPYRKEKDAESDIYDIPEEIEYAKYDIMTLKEEEIVESGSRMRRSSKEKFMQSDSSFEEFSTRIEEYEYGRESEEYDEDYDYEEGDDEYEESSDIEMKYDFERSRISRYLRDEEEEDTFHRNMTMLKLPVPGLPVRPSSKESSPQGSDRSIPVITLNETVLDSSTQPEEEEEDIITSYLREFRRSTERETNKTPERELKKPIQQIPEKLRKTSPQKDSSENILVRKSPEKEDVIIIPHTNFKDLPSPSSTVPKPILKVSRDDLTEKKSEKIGRNIINRISLKKKPESKQSTVSGASSVDSEKRKKKVRIEEPFENDYFEGDENLVMTGEVAKNRRLMNRMKRDVNDPTNVAISHYSDIVRQYGKTNQKPKPRLYLNYEELKAAAEKSNPISEIDLNKPQPAIKPAQTKSPSPRLPQASQPQAREEEPSLGPEQMEESPQVNETREVIDITAPTRFQTVTEFILDLVLFCIALYLYLFKDPRLAIPVLILMIYRKVHETLSNKITPKIAKIRNFFRRQEKIE